MSGATTNKKRSFEFLSLSLLIGLATAILALIFFGWLADQALEGDARRFDDATRAAVHQFATPLLTAIMRGFSFVGSTIALTIGTIVVVVRFVMRKWKREAKLFAITMGGAALLNITLKLAFKRPRPVPFFNLSPPETYSFPSGHSLTSAVFFGALAAILTARIKSKRVRLAIWIVSTAMFFLIGLSRIYLGVHYTTDVIAGFAAALIWILVVRFVEMGLVRRRRRKSGADSRG
ncbi:MAG TPA: phosphatase PAP2 family protein [Pyrinomonadaceae bacterium]|nr:phosphatase PAP2 family protein [Pyrinomonadaceae bacterium]